MQYRVKNRWVILGSVSVIVILLLSITLIPNILYKQTVFDPSLLITWIIASIAILSLVVAWNKYTESKQEKINNQKPRLQFTEVSYHSIPNTTNENVHSTVINISIQNIGNGKALNFQSFVYLIDADNTQWVKGCFNSYKSIIDPDEKLDLKVTHGNLNTPMGTDFHLIIEQKYFDSLEKSYNPMSYFKYTPNGTMKEVTVEDRPNLKSTQKLDAIKKEAKKYANQLSKKYNSNISVDIQLESPDVIEFSVVENGSSVTYYNGSLMFSMVTLIKNAFAGFELKNA